MTHAAAYPWEVPPTGQPAALAARLCAELPELVTDRLRLRAPVLGDFHTYAAILMSERAAFITDTPFTRETAWLDFCQYVAGWPLRGAGLWSVELIDTGMLLGFVSVAMEYGDQEHELGYLFTAEAEGQGYATEAVRAARDHALSQMGLSQLVSYIDPANARSIELAQRLGAVKDKAPALPEGESAEDTAVYRHTLGEGRE